MSDQHLKKVTSYIANAHKYGGTVLFGGNNVQVEGLEHGYYLQPTIIEVQDNQCKLNQEEIAKEEEATAVTLEKAAVGSHNRATEARATAVEQRQQADTEAAASSAAATAAAESATAAAKSAELAKEAAVRSEESMQAAEIALETVKEQCKNATTHGTLWWLDREWEEAKKYMSKSKIAKLEEKSRSFRAQATAFQSR